MDKESLTKLTVAKLKELAKSNGLTGYSALRKDELIDLLTRNLHVVEESPNDTCMNHTRQEVMEMAKREGVTVANKTKQDICNELTVAKNPDAVYSSLTNCMKLDKPELIARAKQAGIPTSKKTKADLCNDLIKWYNNLHKNPDELVNDVYDQSTEIVEELVANRQEWNEVIRRLIKNPPRGIITPEILAQKTPKPALETEAVNMGIDIKNKTKLELATEIYSQTQQLPQCNVEDVVMDTIANKKVARNIVEAVHEAVKPTAIKKIAKKVQSKVNIDGNTALNLAETEIEARIAKQILKVAEHTRAISPDEAIETIEEIERNVSPKPKPRPRIRRDMPHIETPREIPGPSRAPSPRMQSPPRIPGPSRVQSPPRDMPPIPIRSTDTIEELLKELRDTEVRVSDMAKVQKKVFGLLGLLH